jgi:hypothetical protein
VFGDGVVFVLVLPKGFVACCTRDDACQAFDEGENPFTFMNQVLQRDVALSPPPSHAPPPQCMAKRPKRHLDCKPAHRGAALARLTV